MWLREVERRLASRPTRRLADAEGLTPAAVLVPLFVSGGSLWLLLIRRSGAVSQHAGQISFPGGVRHDDDEDEVATALRETGEELGVDPACVVVLGRLDEQRTSTGFLVSPVVGALPYPLELKPAWTEVDSVLRVPLHALARARLVEGQEVGGQQGSEPIFHHGPHRIWGATARIVEQLVARLSGSEPEGAPPRRSP